MADFKFSCSACSLIARVCLINVSQSFWCSLLHEVNGLPVSPVYVLLYDRQGISYMTLHFLLCLVLTFGFVLKMCSINKCDLTWLDLGFTITVTILCVVWLVCWCGVFHSSLNAFHDFSTVYKCYRTSVLCFLSMFSLFSLCFFLWLVVFLSLRPILGIGSVWVQFLYVSPLSFCLFPQLWCWCNHMWVTQWHSV